MTEGLLNINGDSVQTLEILFLTTVMAMLPSLLVMMTSFARYIIVFSFLRSAMGQESMVIEAVRSGAKDFIVKPFKADRVLKTVSTILGNP